MNGKKAKALRRVAQAATVGMPERRRVWSLDGSRVENHEKSTRGLYRRLKRETKKARAARAG